ncbi:MAG: hypothetical protein AAF447_05655 [Myxococcota bacterium]
MSRHLPALAVLALLATPRPAAADAIESFLDGRAAYQSGDYPRAVVLLEDLLLPVPASDDALLVCQARKYLMAGYVLVRQEGKARQEARLLLSDAGCRGSTLDRAAFPEAVVTLYDEVRAVLAEEEREAEARRAAAEREERRRLVAEGARVATIRELIEVAQEQVVEDRNSRWVALVPFGVGQFRNGHRRAGWFFAVSEGLLAGATLGTFIYHQFYLQPRVERFAADANAMPELFPTLRTTQLTLAERRARISNQVLWSSTVAVAVAGVIDAQVRYVPVRTELRRRPLPDTLQAVEEDPDAFAPPEEALDENVSDSQRSPELRLQVLGLGMGLRLSF